MRFLRAAVRLRRWKRRPEVATRLARVREGVPYAASVGLNLLLVTVLAVGYTSFVAKGVVNAGPGERVVTVQLFENLPRPEKAQPEVQAEEPEDEVDEADIGSENLPEGVAVKEGQQIQEAGGEEAPDADLGEQVTTAKLGVEVPQVALPDVDAGEGRPDGIVGVECYETFTDDQNKALECAGRDILSGWRAEVASLGEDWARFSEELGTARRQIRYGPLRAPADEVLQGFAASPYAVPKEVQERYAMEIERLRRLQRMKEFGPEGSKVKLGSDATEESMDASTYDPVAPDVDVFGND